MMSMTSVPMACTYLHHLYWLRPVKVHKHYKSDIARKTTNKLARSNTGSVEGHSHMTVSAADVAVF